MVERARLNSSLFSDHFGLLANCSSCRFVTSDTLLLLNSIDRHKVTRQSSFQSATFALPLLVPFACYIRLFHLLSNNTLKFVSSSNLCLSPVRNAMEAFVEIACARTWPSLEPIVRFVSKTQTWFVLLLTMLSVTEVILAVSVRNL